MAQQNALVVIKYGGNAMRDERALADFAQAVATVAQTGRQVVIVHGGGPQIDHWLTQTGHSSHFVAGQRFTDRVTLDVVEMTLCGHVGKALVRALQQQNLAAVGISGEDGRLLTARPLPALGHVGEITTCQPALLTALLAHDYLPVVAPLALADAGGALNVNADFAAAHLAGALQAETLFLMTNVAGLLDARGQRLPTVTWEEITALTSAGTIAGGMIPKTQCARVALTGGCHSVTILDGRDPQTLVRALQNPAAVGTKILP